MREKNKSARLRPAACIAAAAIVIGSSFGVCYAADVGGIRQTLSAWFEGEWHSVTAEKSDDGIGYTFTIDGEDTTIAGGGVSIDANGNESELSAAAVMDSMSVSVDQEKDGSVWLYYYDKSFNITELLSKGSCRVSLMGKEDKILYFDIEDNGDGGYASSWDTSPKAGHSADEYTRIDSTKD